MPGVSLLRMTRSHAGALLAGRDCGVTLAEGYPHADTADALGMLSDDTRMFLVLAEGSAIGDCGTHGWVDEQGAVEIGYGLAAPWRGRGYGTATVRALVAELAREPEVRALTAGVETANEPSWRVLERLGFALRSEDSATRLYERALPPAPS